MSRAPLRLVLWDDMALSSILGRLSLLGGSSRPDTYPPTSTLCTCTYSSSSSTIRPQELDGDHTILVLLLAGISLSC